MYLFEKKPKTPFKKKLEREDEDFINSITCRISDGSWVHTGFLKSGKDGEYMRDLKTRGNQLHELPRWINEYSDKATESYICPQAFSWGDRSLDNLYALHNIVIDVDCHSEKYRACLREERIEHLINILQEEFLDYGILEPNYIVRTGRGIHIWWQHEAIAAPKGIGTWKSIVKCLIEIINKIIADHTVRNIPKSYVNSMGKRWEVDETFDFKQYNYDLPSDFSVLEPDDLDSLRGLSVDMGKSLNPVSYARIPGTYNPKAKAYANLCVCQGPDVVYSYKELIQWRNEYKANQLAEKERKARETQKTKNKKSNSKKTSSKKPSGRKFMPKKRYQVPGYEWNLAAWAESTAEKIVKLRDMRDADVGNETRNNFCLVMYCLYRAAGLDEQSSMRELNAFNDGFKKPMTERELKSTLTTARRKEYKYSVGAIINQLDISEKEMKEIGLVFDANKEKEEKAKKEKKEKEEAEKVAKKELNDRNKTIVHLYTTTEMTQEEIAKELGLGRTTVGDVLRAKGINRATRKARKIQVLNEKGHSVEQISKKVGRSNRTVYRTLENTAGKNAGGAPKAEQNETTNSETNKTTAPVSAKETEAAVAVSAPERAAEEETAASQTAGKIKTAPAHKVNHATECLCDADICTSDATNPSAVCDKKSATLYNNGYLTRIRARAMARSELEEPPVSAPEPVSSSLALASSQPSSIPLAVTSGASPPELEPIPAVLPAGWGMGVAAGVCLAEPLGAGETFTSNPASSANPDIVASGGQFFGVVVEQTISSALRQGIVAATGRASGITTNHSILASVEQTCGCTDKHDVLVTGESTPCIAGTQSVIASGKLPSEPGSKQGSIASEKRISNVTGIPSIIVEGELLNRTAPNLCVPGERINSPASGQSVLASGEYCICAAEDLASGIAGERRNYNLGTGPPEPGLGDAIVGANISAMRLSSSQSSLFVVEANIPDADAIWGHTSLVGAEKTFLADSSPPGISSLRFSPSAVLECT